MMLGDLGAPQIEVGSSIDMRPRTRAREEALRALFMCDFLDDWSEERCRLYFTHFEVEPEVLPYGSLLCSGVLTDLILIESQITRASEHWSICRMSRLDRCLLRMAVFELNRVKDVPKNVVINEAIELAKVYGSENSPVFVNGVLDRISRMIDEDNGRMELDLAKRIAREGQFIPDGSAATKLVA